MHDPKVFVDRYPKSTIGGNVRVPDIYWTVTGFAPCPTDPASRPNYLRSNRSISLHATRSETFSGYTFFEVTFVEFPQRF